MQSTLSSTTARSSLVLKLKEAAVLITALFAITILPPNPLSIVAAVAIGTIAIRYATIEKELQQKEKK
jgi:hypothetical protein